MLHGFDKFSDIIKGGRLVAATRMVLENMEQELLSNYISFKMYMPSQFNLFNNKLDVYVTAFCN